MFTEMIVHYGNSNSVVIFSFLFSIFKANMNSDKPLQTAAIFFLTNFYLKQGIG